MEVLQKKLAESESKRAEAVKQLKSLSVSAIHLICTAISITMIVGVDSVQSAERTALQLNASRNRINHYFREDYKRRECKCNGLYTHSVDILVIQITPEYILDVSQRLYSIPVQDRGIVVDAVSSVCVVYNT